MISNPLLFFLVKAAIAFKQWARQGSETLLAQSRTIRKSVVRMAEFAVVMKCVLKLALCMQSKYVNSAAMVASTYES